MNDALSAPTRLRPAQILARCALFTTLSAVLSPMSIPIGPVPINFVHISIFVSVGVLGMKYGTLSQMVFVLMGAIGIPVFSNFTAGPGVLFGYTGGFIVGYIGTALLTGFLLDQFGRTLPVIIVAVIVGWIPTYFLGISWFMFVQQKSLLQSVVIFLPYFWGDSFKTIVSVILIHRLSRTRLFCGSYEPPMIPQKKGE